MTRKKHAHYGWHTKNNKLFYRKFCTKCEKYRDVENEHVLYCFECKTKMRSKAHRSGYTQQAWERRHEQEQEKELITSYL